MILFVLIFDLVTLSTLLILNRATSGLDVADFRSLHQQGGPL